MWSGISCNNNYMWQCVSLDRVLITLAHIQNTSQTPPPYSPISWPGHISSMLSLWWLAASIRCCSEREYIMNDPMWPHAELHFPHTEDNICLKFTRFKCRTWCSLHVLLLLVTVTSDHNTQVPWHFSFLRDDANKKLRMKRWSSSFSVFIVGLMRSHLFLKIQFHWKNIELQLREKEANSSWKKTRRSILGSVCPTQKELREPLERPNFSRKEGGVNPKLKKINF